MKGIYTDNVLGIIENLWQANEQFKANLQVLDLIELLDHVL